MKQLLIYGCLGVFILVGIISSTVLAVLFINSQNEIRIRDVQLASCSSLSLDTIECPAPTAVDSQIRFIDEGQDILIEYPSSWNGSLDTTLSSDFSYEPEYGRVITKYDYSLVKSGVTLKFSRIIGGVDGFPFGLENSTHDWFEIPGTSLIRYSDKGLNEWRYVEKLDCSTFGEPFFTPAEVASFDECVGPFFPGFGVVGASTVNIRTSNPTLLEEADLIVTSALN